MVGENAYHTTTVQSIEWNVSKWGQLKPVVLVNPVRLEDITIKRVTAHNAKYVVDNNLGKGAEIVVTRSKEVIPYIVKVVKGAKQPDLPVVQHKWDKNKVNLLVVKAQGIMCVKLLSSLFSKLSIKHVSEKTVEKFYNNGLNNLIKILKASKKDFEKIDGIQKRSAERIHDNIHQGLQNISRSDFIGASGVLGLGLGRKRIKALFLDIPNLLELSKTKSKKDVKKKVIKVEGFSDILAKSIVDNLRYANVLMEKVEPYVTFNKEKRESNSMVGMKIVFSGFRDKELEQKIEQNGGKVLTSVSRNTSIVVVKEKGGNITGKVKKAMDLGKEVLSKDEFIKRL